MGSIVLTCKERSIVSYGEAEELVIYDIDAKRVSAVLKKPVDIGILEDLVEEYDPWVLVTRSLSEDIAESIRDMGLKIVITNKKTIEEYIEDVIAR